MSTYLKVGSSKRQKVADFFQKISSWKSGPNGIFPDEPGRTVHPILALQEDRNHSDACFLSQSPFSFKTSKHIGLILFITEGFAPVNDEQQPVVWPDLYISVLQLQITNELFDRFINTFTLCIRPWLESWIGNPTNASQTRHRNGFTFSRQVSDERYKVFSAKHWV